MRKHDAAWSVALSAALGVAVFFIVVWLGIFEIFDREPVWHDVWRVDEVLAGMFAAALFLTLFYWRSLKRSEENLRRRERRFRGIVDKAADAIVIHAFSGEILDANLSARESLGYSSGELLGKHISEIEGDFDPEAAERHRELLLAGEQLTVDGTHIRKDGSTFPVETRLGMMESDGESAVLSLARDVSESRKATGELRASEGRSRAVLRSIPDAVCRISREGEYLDVWAGDVRRLYQPREVVLGGTVRSILGDEVADRFLPLVGKAIDYGEIQTIEYALDSPEGEFEIEARIVASGEGEAIYFARDVSERNAAIRSLRGSEARNRMILESIPDLVFRFDRDGVYLDYHASETSGLYVSRDEIIGRTLDETVPREVADEALRRIAAALDEGGMQCFEYRLDPPDPPGGVAYFEARMVKSGPGEVTCFARDITGQVGAIEDLRRSEARNRAMLDAIPDAVFRYGRGGEYLDVHVNEEFRAYGDPESFFGKTVEDTLPPEVAKVFVREISEVLEAGGMREFEYDISAGGGDFHREARMVKSGEGEVTCFVRDIGERKEFESRIKRLAYHDELTGLPNRVAFMERLAAAEPDEPEESAVAVAIVSLRGFEKVNDSLGREAGDRLLSMAARHMHGFFGETGEVARFGGDEFAILLRGSGGFEEVLRLIEKGQQIYPRMPFLLDEMEVFLRADVGVAAFEEGDTPEEVVRKASVALFEAKGNPESDYKVYDGSMGERAVERLRLERDLRLALEYGQLEVHYQPEVFLSSGRIYSLEALARWNHPEHGAISPGFFIPLAEESGLIIRLGEYVLEEACRRMRMWREALSEAAPCSVSVNVSAFQLRQRDLVPRISRVLEENGLEPECLQIEITESAAMEDLGSCRRVFGELKELGIRIALDDFGTGYSSLSYLRQFPIDSLKVDRSFVSTLEDDPQMANVVGSIIELAHALELEVVSEGIETPGQLSTLRRLGCDIGQGYHFSRPVPPEEALDLLASWQTLDLLHGSG
jgi:diguanylate cyclase (GGDEF)-like protein/PAS domain S-box-containing protein